MQRAFRQILLYHIVHANQLQLQFLSFLSLGLHLLTGVKVGKVQKSEKTIWGPGAVPLVGSRGKAPCGGQGAKPPEGEAKLNFK